MTSTDGAMTSADDGLAQAQSAPSWAAKLNRVREVGLRGEADAGFWRARLDHFGFAPAERDGRAQIAIVTADAVFRGLRFQEASVSIALAAPSGGRLSGCVAPSALFLLGAFTSRWIFAQAERRLFRAPYAHAAVAARATLPLGIQVVHDGIEVLTAAMGASDEAAQRVPTDGGEAVGSDPMEHPRLVHRVHKFEGEDNWEGRVFLPPLRAGVVTAPSYFVARLRGSMRVYPFADVDALTLRFLEPSDAPSLLAIFSDPEVMRYWSTAPWTSLDDAQERIARDQEAMAAGTYICLGIVRRSDEVLMGERYHEKASPRGTQYPGDLHDVVTGLRPIPTGGLAG